MLSCGAWLTLPLPLTFVCLCSTRVCMVWQLSPWMNSNVLQAVLDTVELIHLLLCHLASLPINCFSQGQQQTGTLFLPPSEPSSLLILSRKPSTNSQTILLIIAEPCHSSSNGRPPIAGYSLKNWRILFYLNNHQSTLNFSFYRPHVNSMTTRQPTAHYHRSQQQEPAPVLVLVGGDGQDARAIHGSSRSATVHLSAFMPNGPMLVVVATVGWRNGPLLSTWSDDDMSPSQQRQSTVRLVWTVLIASKVQVDINNIFFKFWH